ncbi:MAG: hypothetical protein LHV68_08165 [Elusimicrobia bacterium]|nr:hypothetical protein [Candidatus Liberimonas magnetica]
MTKLKITKQTKSLFNSLKTVSRTVLLSEYPILLPIVLGYDVFKKHVFDRNAKTFTNHLELKVADVKKLLCDKWLKTKDGNLFVNKIFASAMDAQIEEKQELFVNALINGINNKKIPIMKKLKFIDILRNMSCSAVLVLIEIDKVYREPLIKYLNKSSCQPVQIDKRRIINNLKNVFEPYLVDSAIEEMKSLGIFSSTTEWYKYELGEYRKSQDLGTGFAYTSFSYQFYEFIKSKETDI